MGIITLSEVDCLWWLGRYTERVYTTLRTFFPYYDACIDRDPENFRMFSDAIDVDADMSDFGSFLYDFLYNKTNRNSVCASMNAAFDNAIMLRPEIGTDTLAYVELALTNLREGKNDWENKLDMQRGCIDNLLTFWGAIEDGNSNAEVKAFLMAGKYLERIDLFSRFQRPEEDFAAPMARLQFHLGILPEGGRGLLSDALNSVADVLGTRGYSEELVSRFKAFMPAEILDADGNVVSAGDAVDE